VKSQNLQRNRYERRQTLLKDVHFVVGKKTEKYQICVTSAGSYIRKERKRLRFAEIVHNERWKRVEFIFEIKKIFITISYFTILISILRATKQLLVQFIQVLIEIFQYTIKNTVCACILVNSIQCVFSRVNENDSWVSKILTGTVWK